MDKSTNKYVYIYTYIYIYTYTYMRLLMYAYTVDVDGSALFYKLTRMSGERPYCTHYTTSPYNTSSLVTLHFPCDSRG